MNVKLPSYLDLYWVEYNRTLELKPSVWLCIRVLMLPIYYVAGLHREVHLDAHKSYT